jgi:succinate dehydrogenase / fumarate reductase cytochrome b subunit
LIHGKQGIGMSGKNNKRPVYLNLLHIRLPVGGVVSILHRVTGVTLVLALPGGMFLLRQSLVSPESYSGVSALLKSLPMRIGLLLLALSIAHHFFAGLRHLLLDLDIGISKTGSRRGAWLVLAAVAAIAAGSLLIW